MRVVIFGASGATGQPLIRACLARQWSPVAVLRPECDWLPPDGVVIVRGALTDPVTLDTALTAADAACCVFGPRPGQPEPFCAAATGAILAALRRAGVGRCLCQTGAMIGRLGPNVTWPMRLLATAVWRRYPTAAADRTAQEDLLAASDVAWTIVRPPRLTTSRPTGHYRTDPRLRVGLLSHLDRADLAHFYVDELTTPRYLRQKIYIAH